MVIRLGRHKQSWLPSTWAGIDWSASITQSLVAAGAGNRTTEESPATVFGTGIYRPVNNQLAIGATSSTGYFNLRNNYSPATYDGATLFFVTLAPTGTTNGPGGIISTGGTGGGLCWGWQAARLMVGMTATNGNGFRTWFDPGSLATNQIQAAAVTLTGLTTWRAYINGRSRPFDGNQGTGTILAPNAANSGKLGIGRIGNGAIVNIGTTTSLLAWGIWHRQLSNEELEEVTRNPGIIFNNYKPRIYSFPSGGATYLIDGNVDDSSALSGSINREAFVSSSLVDTGLVSANVLKESFISAALTGGENFVANVLRTTFFDSFFVASTSTTSTNAERQTFLDMVNASSTSTLSGSAQRETFFVADVSSASGTGNELNLNALVAATLGDVGNVLVSIVASDGFNFDAITSTSQILASLERQTFFDSANITSSLDVATTPPVFAANALGGTFFTLPVGPVTTVLDNLNAIIGNIAIGVNINVGPYSDTVRRQRAHGRIGSLWKTKKY